MNGVVLEQVHEVISVHEWVIDSHDSGGVLVAGEGGSENETADSSEAVDTHLDVRHLCVCFVRNINIDYHSTPINDIIIG